jgi:hypothetical protein
MVVATVDEYVPLDYPTWTGRFAAVIETILNFEEWGISREGAMKLAQQALDDYETAKAAA